MASKAENIQGLISQLQRWEKGEITDFEASHVISVISRRLDNACYCDDNVCCRKHGKHSVPHQNCILR